MDQSRVSAVAGRIRRLIHAGTLSAGDALPSTRALAAELGVARGTVVAAYEQLDGEGYIRTRQGAVARVEAAVHLAWGTTVAGRPVLGAGDDRSAPRVDASPRPLVDAVPGVPAVTAISLRDWRAAWRAAAELPLRNGASPEAGTDELREQIVAQLGLSRGFTPSRDRVLVAAGTSEAISLIVEALRGPLGRAPRIAVEDPGYRGGRAAAASAGAAIVPIPVGVDGLDLDALGAAGALDAVMLTPTHQYPLGSVMPVARRRELLEWAAAHAVVVVEDDYDSEFRHRGAPVPALAALDAEGVVVHLGGFSKILDPRLRCAYVVTPAAPIAAAVRRVREARGPVVAEPVQAALAHLMRSGALRRHLGRVRRDYAHKRERIARRLAAFSAPGVTAHALNGGLHVVVTWDAAPYAADVVAQLAGRGIRLADLADYYVDGERHGALNGVVIGYGGVPSTGLDAAFDALLDALRGGLAAEATHLPVPVTRRP